MAFPIPDHLPKRPTPVDVSSKILYKIDASTKETLNSSLASLWIRELDESIQLTKQHIHDRIQSELPKFQQQLETSGSLQTEFAALTSQLDGLCNAISDPKEGILPTLVTTLTAHSALAQDTSDAEAIHEALSYLLQCGNAYSSVVSLISTGKLPEAVKESANVQQLLDGLPEFLKQTTVIKDLEQKFRASGACIEDQLSDAYSRSVVITPIVFIIRTLVQVRQSDTILDLRAIFESLSTDFLSSHVNTLRRDFLSYFIDYVLKQPYSLNIDASNPNEFKLTLKPSPPNIEDLRSRLDNISHILDFLSSHLIPHLPESEGIQFTRSLSKPIATSVLNNLLIPSLPSSFGLLPSFLSLLKRAVLFEESDINKLLGGLGNEGVIKAWSDGVSGHYERRRRIEILELARKDIVEAGDYKDTFKVVAVGGLETSRSIVPIQDEDFKDDAWGFDEPVTSNPLTGNADGWGFDDDMNSTMPIDAATPVEEERRVELEPERPLIPMDIDETQDINGDEEVDPADAWGWNEEEDIPVEAPQPAPVAEVVPEDDAWDDPWSDSGEVNSQPEPPPPTISHSFASPKAATRLEKSASKHKNYLNGNSTTNSPSSSPSIHEIEIPQHTTLPPPSLKSVPQSQPEHNREAGHLNGVRRPANVITTVVPKEYYQVLTCTKRFMRMVETVIDESKLFYASNLFPASKDTVPAPGTILLQSASSILDLYQALYPVKFAEDLKLPERRMLFSNSCLYMVNAVQQIEDTIYGESVLKDRLSECRHHLQLLSESWFTETVEQQRQAVDKSLTDGARGFIDTGDQDRYDECETAVNQVLKDIKRLALQFKDVLAKSKYYNAIGSVTDAALSRVLQDVLELNDIPELESHRLSELCRILNALEGLFCEDPEQPSFVVAYVPRWLKFSYLSELLEASLADITYLFEQGALVDFEVDELVNLVRALFADTALRTNTINKILGGHPPSQ